MKNGCALEFASDEFKDNKKMVMKAVKNCGLALFFASARLRNNPKIVLQAVEEDWKAIYFASDELKMNIGFMNLVQKFIPSDRQAL